MTPATDVFAFGATLAYALTGDTPFGSGASSEVMLYRVVHEEPDLSEVPAPLAPLIGACLAKEPMERPGAAHLHERLSELAARAGAARGRAAAASVPPPAAGVREREQERAVAARDSGLRESAAREAERAERAAREADEARALGRPRFARSQPYPPPHGGAPLGHPPAAPVPPARPRQEAGGRPQPRDRQHTPPPGRALDARRRLRRQRLVVFITVTIGVALAIAAAQGCENRHAQGLLPLPRTVARVAAAGPNTPGEAGGLEGAGPAIGLSADGAQPSVAAPAARTGGGTGSAAASATLPASPGTLSGLGPAGGPVPPVDWPDRSYNDPAGGPPIALRGGRSATDPAPGAPVVTLTSVLPARYRGAPATVVVLRRTEGSVPVDLIELFGFAADSPSRSPRAVRPPIRSPPPAGGWRRAPWSARSG